MSVVSHYLFTVVLTYLKYSITVLHFDKISNGGECNRLSIESAQDECTSIE